MIDLVEAFCPISFAHLTMTNVEKVQHEVLDSMELPSGHRYFFDFQPFLLKDCDFSNIHIPVTSSDVEFSLDGDLKKAHRLNVPFYALPSHFSSIAFKLNHRPEIGLPYISVKASPAKLIQGHNVWGYDDLRSSLIVLLTSFAQALPNLFSCIDFNRIEIRKLDINYSFRMQSENELLSVLDFMSHIKVKNLKPSRSQNTTYLGNTKSKHFFVRLYEKHQEFSKHKNNDILLENLEFISEFSKSLLRVEVAVRKDSIKAFFGTNNVQTILSRWDDTTAKNMWSTLMKDIVNKIGDVTLAPKSDDEILELLKSKYYRITPKGNISYSSAQNLFNFYLRIVYQGYEVVKQTTSKSTFYDTIRKLESIGLMQTRLQQFEGGTSDHCVIIPFIKIVDLTKAVEPPTAQPSLDFLDQGYMNAIIDLLAS